MAFYIWKKIMILSVENYTLAVLKVQPRWQNGLIWQSQLNYERKKSES